MADALDLAAYARRIGFQGKFKPDLVNLRELVRAHVTQIPFENLDVLLGKPILLTPSALEEKIVHRRRGGYCFENNGCMLQVLEQIGFDVTPLAGRVRLGAPADAITPRTHIFMKVVIDDEAWLVDVSVGGLSLTSPIRFELDIEQPTDHEPRRIIQQGTRSFHQYLGSDGWLDVYEFGGDEMPLVDRQVGNWWTSTHPETKFRNNLFVALAQADGTRYGILNNRFTHRRGPDVLSESTIESPGQLEDLLEARFGLSNHTAEELDIYFAISTKHLTN